jgi:hypothetical protein
MPPVQKLSAAHHRKKIPEMEHFFDELSAQQCQFRLVQEVAISKMNLAIQFRPNVGIPPYSGLTGFRP